MATMTVDSAAARARMVRDQLADCADARVVAAMGALPRERFMPPQARGKAYVDGAVEIGAGQTISQPRLVAQMLALLALTPGMRALDVGCGSGYVAALLAHLVAPGVVHAIERQPALVARTAPLLAELAPNARLVLGDGLLGLPAQAPFAAIHVAAACPRIPRALTDQLAPGGRLVIPVGPYGGIQELVLVERHADGWRESRHGEVRFVPGLPGVPSG